MSDNDGIRADWATKDFYAELGVDKKATQAEIKKAYRKLARANHPDSNPGDTAKHEKFKAVAEAYDVVGDEEKRKKYDEVRELYGGGGFRGGPGWPAAGPGFDLGDLLRDRAGRLRRPVRRHLRRPRRRPHADPDPPGPRRRRREHRHDRLHRRPGRRHDQPAADLRLAPAPTATAPAASPAPSRRSARSARAPASSSTPPAAASR